MMLAILMAVKASVMRKWRRRLSAAFAWRMGSGWR